MKTTKKQIEKILEIGSQITTGVPIDDLLHRIVSVAAILTKTEAAGILLYDERENRLRFVATSLFNDRLLDISVPIDNSIVGIAFASGQTVIVSDVENDPRRYRYRNLEEAISYKTRSLLAVPLQYKERKIGVLEIENKYGDLTFGASDVEILTLLACQATIAIENVRLYQSAQEELAERNRAEVELRQHRDNLSELVKERTAELETALAEAKRLNQQLSLEISERERLISDLKTFSSTVAHDIKGPLGTILGYSELITRDSEQSGLTTLSGWSNEIGAAVLQIGKIVDALLLLTRVRQQEVTLSRLEMGTIVGEAQKRLASRIEQTHTQIIVPKKWPATLGYAPWIEEVWVNYLNNAIQYGGDPPKIELGARTVTNPQTGGAEVSFWMRDNGQGLSIENQAKLFVEFERLGKSRSTGHGLGLSIVKRIVTKMGGRVGVQSNPGRGSEFFFTLPVFDQINQ